MATLLITKKPSNEYSFIVNGDSNSEILNLRNDLTVVGSQCHFKTSNGANLIKEQNISYSDVTLIATGTFTFVSVYALFSKLKEIGFFDWINGTGTGGVTKFSALTDTFSYFGKAGKAVVVSPDELSLETITIHNYRNFVDLEDTFDVIVPNKMLVTDSTGTGIILRDIPQTQVDNLPFNNKIKTQTGFTLTGQNLTINPLWEWKLQGIDYTNLVSQVVTFPYSATGLSRIDYVVPNNANGFDRIIGQESATPVAPQIPHEGMYVTFVLVTSAAISAPALPDLSAYATLDYVDGKDTTLGSRITTLENAGIAVVDATATVKGIIKLAGDLAGTADLPTVPALANKVDKVTGKSLILDTEITRLAGVSNIDISGKVDKVTGERLINAGEITKLANQSGTNTGDETALSIITKIGDGTKINQSYLPSYVDDVLEYANLAGFPATGESGKIYVAIDSSKQYRWTGSAYLQITNGLIASTADVPENVSFLYFTTARVLATLLSGLSLATGGAIVSTDSVLIALGKLQKQISDNITAIGLKQDALVSGTNIKTVNGTSLLGSGDIAIVGGGGDMVLASTQTVSGLKTFLGGMFGLRNVANTFTSYFTNTNTASRTYTLKDRNGTLLDDTDFTTLNTAISAKAAALSGTLNYLAKFTSATAIGISRFFDDGTFFGLGTANAPTKDFTLGNQANKVIGIEQSSSSTAGRDLDIEAGRTINFALNGSFNALSQTSRGWKAMTTAPNGNIYACVDNGDIYMQTGGTGNFVGLGQATRGWAGLASASNGNIYASVQGGDIYMQTNGTGSFVALGQASRTYENMTVGTNGNVYVCVYGGDIYMQTNGTGNFVALGQATRDWFGLATSPNGNIYATVVNGDIYMQTNGIGNFLSLTQVNRAYWGVTVAPNGNAYVGVNNGDIYMQTNGTGNFVALGQTSRTWFAMTTASNGNVYASTNGGDIYLQSNYSLGTANLDGGTQRTKAGTGKGTGKSRLEGWTGQKTTSGTDMQVLTKRYEYDENGHYTLFSIPTYADNAAAIAGGLTTGKFYRTSTGVLMIVY